MCPYVPYCQQLMQHNSDQLSNLKLDENRQKLARFIRFLKYCFHRWFCLKILNLNYDTNPDKKSLRILDREKNFN